MRRRLFNLAAVLSLMLFVATTALCARSHWVCHTLQYARVEPTEGWLSHSRLSSTRGLVAYRRCYQAYRLLPGGPPAFGPKAKPEWQWALHRQDARWVERPLGGGFNGLGFGFERRGSGSMNPPEYAGSVREWAICVPHWFLALLFGVLPAWFGVPYAWKRTKEWWRGQPGRCRQCGYDLRATSDRCPECGAAPTAPAEP